MSDKKDKGLQTEYFDCECMSPEHTLRFTYFVPEDEPAELYTEIYLCQYRNIFSRIWIAIKYIFGYKCRYGHFDVWTLRRKDCERLRDLANKIINFDNIINFDKKQQKNLKKK